MKKTYRVVCDKYKKFKNPKVSYILQKIISPFYYFSKCNSKIEKIFKEKESIEIMKILNFVNNIEKYQMIWQNTIEFISLDWKK